MLINIALVSNDYEIVQGFRTFFASVCRIKVFTNFATLFLCLSENFPDYILVDYTLAKQLQQCAPCFLKTTFPPLYIITRFFPCKKDADVMHWQILSFPQDIPLLFQKSIRQTEMPSATVTQILHSFVGVSQKVIKIRQQIMQAAQSMQPVLITGETGTGKGLTAQLIHRLSARGKREMKQVNVTTIPENLAESTLFGTVRGAFTDAVTREGLFESARGTTLFLDEIGDVALPVQAKLLSVLEQGTFQSVGSITEKHTDARLIFATNADMRAKLAQRTFRSDLYYRIAQFVIRIPSLRDRTEDIVPLAHAFLENRGKHLTASAALLLTTFDWYGNVRQLHHCLEHAILLSDTDAIDVQHIVVN